MVKKFPLLLLFVVIITLIYFHFNETTKLKKKIDLQEQDIEASLKYIERLTSQLNQQQLSDEEISKSEKLRKMLDSYLNEQREDNSEQKLKVTIDELQDELKQYEKRKRFIPDITPVSGEYAVSQRFFQKHPAIDFAASVGTEVIASAAGEVISVYEDKYFGNVILIDHLNGYSTLYAHLAKALIHPKRFVQKGEVIALVGNTGNSTAPHLHFEIKLNKKYIDPENLLIDIETEHKK